MQNQWWLDQPRLLLQERLIEAEHEALAREAHVAAHANAHANPGGASVRLSGARQRLARALRAAAFTLDPGLAYSR